MAKQNFFVNEDELDNFQIQLIQKRINSSMLVSGCAGSGKSILALWKAKQIQELSTGETYIFIVYTKALKRYMADGIRAIGLNDANFTHHYQWVASGCPEADYIIVDEIQDFTKEEIQQFKQAAKKNFFFWGDSAQSIYRKYRNTQEIMEIAFDENIPPEQLVFNHRLPKSIARLAAIVGRDDELVDRCLKEGAYKPYILQYRTSREQLDACMEVIKNRQITDVAILFPDNRAVKASCDYLRSKGHTVEAKYKGQHYEESLDFTSSHPKLMTYHSSKGTQFEAVFLPECAEKDPEEQKTIYVAMTRSYQYLYIMYSESLSPFFDTAGKDLYETEIESSDIEL